MTPARRLIVNADDYGLTAGVSRGILDAHRDGIVTSTTLLVNRPVDPALIDALKASGLGVGLHLNLTLGPPVAPAKRVPSLVDGEGRFVRDAREAAKRARADEARIELGMQIDEFRRIMGRFPTHLDSHHHVGRHEPILDLVLDFARAQNLCDSCLEALRVRPESVATSADGRRVVTFFCAPDAESVRHAYRHAAVPFDRVTALRQLSR